MKTALIQHWKVYLMEAICLGLFMISACVFSVVFEYPGSFIRQHVDNEFLRRCLMGLAMGSTATAIIYSPMGKLSGAHMNPAISITFLRLRKLKVVDTIYYVLFQCIGGIAAVFLMKFLLAGYISETHVNYVITKPGKVGEVIAFITEIVIAIGMMVMVLFTSNDERTAPLTGIIAGILVACYVISTGPVSGFSMNPARTLASAVPAMQFDSFWIYMTAPFIGMLLGAEIFKLSRRNARCGKIYHSIEYECIFNCEMDIEQSTAPNVGGTVSS